MFRWYQLGLLSRQRGSYLFRRFRRFLFGQQSEGWYREVEIQTAWYQTLQKEPHAEIPGYQGGPTARNDDKREGTIRFGECKSRTRFDECEYCEHDYRCSSPSWNPFAASPTAYARGAKRLWPTYANASRPFSNGSTALHHCRHCYDEYARERITASKPCGQRSQRRRIKYVLRR